MQFLLKRVVVWLAEVARSDTEHLVEMVFSSLYCCNQEETTQILNHITTVKLSLVCCRAELQSWSIFFADMRVCCSSL